MNIRHGIAQRHHRCAGRVDGPQERLNPPGFLFFVPASSGRLAVRIVAHGPHTSLARFGARQTRRGVSAAPWGKRHVSLLTFIITKLDGHVFVRTTRKHFPIKILFGPAIPIEMIKDATAQTFFDTAPRAVEAS